MRFVGLDLAWGENAWTGVAVLDESGRLLQLERVRSDAEIQQRLAPHSAGSLLVGIDAPLVVANRSGRRPCETQISRVYGRFHAGAHSSNLALASFRGGPRGGRVAALLGLDVDPDFPPRSGVRRALEVYPHPATVTLFGLDRVLPYKAKPGRTPQTRRAAFLELLDRVERLAEAVPPMSVDGEDWARCRTAVESATSHRELNEWEDAVDAVLCAYVVLHRWWHGDAESRVYGDVENGYIVVPLDERVRNSDVGAGRPLSNADVERLAIELLTRHAEAHGHHIEDTRHRADAPADLVIDGRHVEVKASAGTSRGQDLWLEPAQAQGLRDGSVDLVLVDHVRADGSGVVTWLRQDALTALLPRLKKHRYFTLSVPTATHNGLPAEHVPPL